MQLTVECEYENSTGHWIAAVVELPGVSGYHHNRGDAIDEAISLAREVMDDRIRHDEWDGSVDDLKFAIKDKQGDRP